MADPVRQISRDRSPASGAGQYSLDATPRLWPLTAYFLKLGALGFGGPVALVGFMHRDLVERRRLIREDTYKLSLALAQIMPGPLAAQTAIAIGYFAGGVTGATVVGLSFILPSFLMVIAIAFAYVAYGGLWWMQALFYAIGATVIAIIAAAAATGAITGAVVVLGGRAITDMPTAIIALVSLAVLWRY